MICREVIALIHGLLPMREWQPDTLAEVERHARDCAACGRALAAATALEAELGRVPQPDAPPDLAAVVMSRVASLEGSRAPGGARRARRGRELADRFAAAAMLLGVVTFVGAELFGLWSGDLTLELVTSRSGFLLERLTELSQSGPLTYVFATGLAVYLIGMLGLRTSD